LERSLKLQNCAKIKLADVNILGR